MTMSFSDPLLPDIVKALDADTVMHFLHDRLPECRDRLKLVSGRIGEVLYNPEVSCTVLYRVKFRNRASGHTFQKLFSGRVLRINEEPEVPDEKLLKLYHARQEEIRAPFLHIPEIHMTLQAFPLDESLPWLFDAMNVRSVSDALNRMWGSSNVQGVDIQLMGYVPHMRAAFRYDVTDTVSNTTRPFVAKMHYFKGAARRFAGAWTLWRAAEGRVHFAPPAGYLSTLHVSLQEYLATGERLGKLVESSSFASLLRETAGQIRKLHALKIPLVSHRTPQNEVQVVLRWEKVLKAIRPDLAKRVEALCRKLCAELETRTRMSAPVHGDFQYTNVLVNENRITLIDLDEMAYGDPLVDLGRLLSSLRLPFLRRFGRLNALEESRAAFLDEYFGDVPRDEPRIRLFEAASLLISAASSFRKQRPKWHEEALLILDECEKVLESAASRSTIDAPSPVETKGGPMFSMEGRLQWATDEKYIQAMMDPYIEKQFGAELTKCQIIGKYETERRYRIRYVFRGWVENKEWKASMQGLLWKDHSGRRLWNYLKDIDTAPLKEKPFPLLPVPVAYLSSIQMGVTSSAGMKIAFSVLLGTPDGETAASSIGRALASLHRIQVQGWRIHSLENQFANLRNKIEKYRTHNSVAASEALELFNRINSLSSKVPELVAPTVRVMLPSRIFWEEGTVAFPDVDMLTLSHPWIDVGGFLSQLALLGFQKNLAEAATAASDRFKASYFDAVRAGTEGFEILEAAALLGLACTEGEKSHDIAEYLLERARIRLDH